MKNVELYGRVRYAVQIEGLSERAAARRFGLDPRTVNKMMKFWVPPGYVRKKPPAKPKLDPFIRVIDRILADDESRPKKQQHTAKRLFERLRDEHGFTGGITIVKDYVAGWRQRTRESSPARDRRFDLPVRVDFERKLITLAEIADIGLVVQALPRLLDSLLAQPSARIAPQLGEDVADLAPVGVVDGARKSLGEFVLHVRIEEAKGDKTPGVGGTMTG
jgi:hypothetical protein